MRNLLIFFVCSGLFIAPAFGEVTSDRVAKPIVLHNSVGQLSVHADGAMRFQATNPACPAWKLNPATMWEMVLAKGTNAFHLSKDLTFLAGKNRPKCSAIEDGVELVYNAIRHGKQTWDLGLTIRVKQVGDEFQFSATIENRTENRTVKSFKFPILSDIRHEGSDHQGLSVLWPSGLGLRLATPKLFGKRRMSGQFPSGVVSMQWCEVTAEGAGLYLGCHDSRKSRKEFAMTNRGSHYAFSLSYDPYCLPGERWQSPPTVVLPFEGTWHVGARRYRKWVDTWLSWAETPDWIKNDNSGWFLCIMKQQNGEVMFRYDELDTVADLADQWGLNVLGLFGWAHGGHDRAYPHYYPDPKMGGPEVLKAAIKRVQKRGKKVILYANGQLIDAASDFYREQGVGSMMQQADQTPYVQMYNKFKSTSTPIFVQACLGSETWYRQLLTLGFQAQDLGADGILYDQLGALGTMVDCYNESHDHKTPASCWAQSRFKLIKRLTEEFHKRDPHFIVMTEGVIDGILADMPYFHGCRTGAFHFKMVPNRKPFPEMFRYTYPELIATQRNCNPTSDRYITNFATFFGQRHEVESRYTADVTYLKDHRFPTREAYDDVNFKPRDLHLVFQYPIEEGTKYLRDVIALERQFKEFLWHGRFIDTEGITLSGGENCDAKAFQAADGRRGVVVWNYGDQPQKVTLSVDGFRLENAYEPGTSAPVDPKAPIPAETIRFYVWHVHDRQALGMAPVRNKNRTLQSF